MASSSSEEFEEDETLLSRPKRIQGLCSQYLHTKSARLISMLMLVVAYFLAEIIVGEQIALSDVAVYLVNCLTF